MEESISALIGYTGFVGSNLAVQYKFNELYNSKNIQEIRGKNYDLVVSAGARAEKWRINQEPKKDLDEINGLIDNLRNVKAKKFVLISTVDVYSNPSGVDEDTLIDTAKLQAYGYNRYRLEQFCSTHFDCLIVRLPGLFGQGLKKNIIYDFLHDNNVDKIHWAGSFQYYNLSSIWKDIKIALKNNLSIVNFATEPIQTNELADRCFGIKNFRNQPAGITPGSYDMHTKHARLYGETGSYIYEKSEVLRQIKGFVKNEHQ